MTYRAMMLCVLTPIHPLQVTYRAMMLCVGVYVAMGVMGSLEFGERTPGNLLLAYHEDMMRG